MERKQLTALTHLIHEIDSPEEFEAALTALASRALTIRDGKPKPPPLSLAYWGSASLQVWLVAKDLEEMRAP